MKFIDNTMAVLGMVCTYVAVLVVIVAGSPVWAYNLVASCDSSTQTNGMNRK